MTINNLEQNIKTVEQYVRWQEFVVLSELILYFRCLDTCLSGLQKCVRCAMPHEVAFLRMHTF